jgi:hypothetical protein
MQLETKIKSLLKMSRGRDRVVGKATGYGLDYRGVGVRVPIGPRNSLFYGVQTNSGTHTDS